MVALINQHVHVELDLDRGAELVHIGPDHATNVLAYYDWQTPLPVSRSMPFGDDRQDWLSSYRGGWQELFPNAGLACRVGNVPLPFHGEVSVARWEVIDQTATSVTVSCPSRLPLIVERRVELSDDAPTMRITGSVHNESDLDVSFLWGHHPAYESPPGTVIDLPEGVTFDVGDGLDPHEAHVVPGATGAWPLAEGAAGEQVDLSVVPEGPVARVIHLRGGPSWYAIRPPSGPGLALSWDVETYPVVWLWQQIGGTRFPTYGRSRITALEPNRTAPGDGLAAAIERGEALVVGPRATSTTWLTATLLPVGAGRVTEVDASGRVWRES